MPYARTTTGAHVATELVALYRHQLEGCRLERGESCLIITDTAWDATASAACLGAALALDAKPIILTLPYGSPFPGVTGKADIGAEMGPVGDSWETYRLTGVHR